LIRGESGAGKEPLNKLREFPDRKTSDKVLSETLGERTPVTGVTEPPPRIVQYISTVQYGGADVF
jgi:hypothetical protein